MIETGWLIEDRASTSWAMLDGAGLTWTKNSDAATRFSREVDATDTIRFLWATDRFSCVAREDIQATEHQWS